MADLIGIVALGFGIAGSYFFSFMGIPGIILGFFIGLLVFGFILGIFAGGNRNQRPREPFLWNNRPPRR